MLDGLEVVRAGRGRGGLQQGSSSSSSQVLALPDAEEAAPTAGVAVAAEQQQEVQQLEAFMQRMGIRSQLPLHELVAAGAGAPAGSGGQWGAAGEAGAPAGGILAAACEAGAAGRVALLRPALSSRPGTAAGRGSVLAASRPGEAQLAAWVLVGVGHDGRQHAPVPAWPCAPCTRHAV
jgi:hypothetical protein